MPEQRTFLRPIGFRPWEISSLINQDVIDQHAEEAAFLWTQRDRAASSPQYALKDLAKLDERVEAHVDGLRIAGPQGWRAAVEQLDQGVGEVFSSSLLAFGAGDAEKIASVFKVASSSPRLMRPAISALGWMPVQDAEREAKKLASSIDPDRKALGIAGLAVHRLDPGAILFTALSDPNITLASRAARVAGELGRTDLLGHLRKGVDLEDEELSFWSAWSSVRLGDRGLAAEILREFVKPESKFAVRALSLYLIVASAKSSFDLFESLAGDSQATRLAITAAGVLGDPVLIPWLIAQMENPAIARIAGASFSTITGADLSYLDLEGDPPASWDIEDEVLAPSEESNLQWPSPVHIAKWWDNHTTSLSRGTRYLAGKPITDTSLHEVLAEGRQNQRAAAALELAIRHPDDPIFETRERAQWQLKKVAPWSS